MPTTDTLWDWSKLELNKEFQRKALAGYLWSLGNPAVGRILPFYSRPPSCKSPNQSEDGKQSTHDYVSFIGITPAHSHDFESPTELSKTPSTELCVWRISAMAAWWAHNGLHYEWETRALQIQTTEGPDDGGTGWQCGLRNLSSLIERILILS